MNAPVNADPAANAYAIPLGAIDVSPRSETFDWVDRVSVELTT